MFSANVAGKPFGKALQASTDEVLDDSNDVESVRKTTSKPNNSPEPSQAMSKMNEKQPEVKDGDFAAPATITQHLGALKISEKRDRPEELDLRMSKERVYPGMDNATSQETSNKVPGDAKSQYQGLSQPSTPAANTAQPSASNSARKSQNRAIQVTDVPKQEASSPGAIALQTSTQTSRRPSLTSLNRPETPLSEKVSDNLSFTSASISRTNSPPPTRVGSAPTRRVTKSQQKKERQERAKKAGEVATQKEEPVSRSEEPVVQAPIIGRKKKTKKTKEKTGATADSTPTATRPTSPEPQMVAAKSLPVSQAGDAGKGSKENNKQIKLPPIASLDPETKTSATAQPSALEPDQEIHIQSTVAGIFASLRASGQLRSNVIETLFKSVTSASHRLDQNLDPQLILNKSDNLKLDQIARLDNDEPVVTVLDRNNAVLILPNRRYLRGLNPAQADRYRELYLQGARACISSSTKEDQDLLDLLMPAHDFSGEKIPVPVLGAADLKSTTQLNNRFAEPLTPQAIPSAPLSVRLNTSVSKAPPGRGDKSSVGLEEAELALAAERKNTEALEKRLNALIKKNRRLVLGSGN